MIFVVDLRLIGIKPFWNFVSRSIGCRLKQTLPVLQVRQEVLRDLIVMIEYVFLVEILRSEDNFIEIGKWKLMFEIIIWLLPAMNNHDGLPDNSRFFLF